MALILLCFLASAVALPLSNEADEDDIDEDLILGSSCTLGAREADGSFNVEQIKECGSCWEDIGDTQDSEEANQAADECIEKFFPNIGFACEGVFNKTEVDKSEAQQRKEALLCFFEYVKDNDPEGVIQAEVRSYLDEIKTNDEVIEEGSGDEIEEGSGEVDDAEFIIGTSCTIEAFETSGELNETRIEECGKCWEAAGDALSETGLPLARKCVQMFLPNIGEACKEVLEQLEVGDYEKGKEAFECFLDYVELNDEDGEIQAGVGRYLEESLDSDFVIGTSCTIEALEFGQSLGDDFDLEEGVAACSNCFEGVEDLISEEGLEKAAECRRIFTPRINKDCPHGEVGNQDEQRKVLRCFYDFVLDNDPDEVVQIGVRDYLDSRR